MVVVMSGYRPSALPQTAVSMSRGHQNADTTEVAMDFETIKNLDQLAANDQNSVWTDTSF